jgi:hypothetical protein
MKECQQGLIKTYHIRLTSSKVINCQLDRQIHRRYTKFMLYYENNFCCTTLARTIFYLLINALCFTAGAKLAHS